MTPELIAAHARLATASIEVRPFDADDLKSTGADPRALSRAGNALDRRYAAAAGDISTTEADLNRLMHAGEAVVIRATFAPAAMVLDHEIALIRGRMY